MFVRPGDPLAVLVQRLFAHRCSMAPIVSGDPAGAHIHVVGMDNVSMDMFRIYYVYYVVEACIYIFTLKDSLVHFSILIVSYIIC